MYWNVPRIVPRSVSVSREAGSNELGDDRGRHDLHALVLAREAEIEQLGPRARDHHVARLQVAVHDPASVRAVEGGGDLGAQLEHVLQRQPTLLEPPGERLPFDQFEHEVVQLAAVHFRASHVVERADVGMVQGGDALRLALEPRPELGIRGQLRREQLQGHVALQAGVAGAIDLAHPAGAQRHRDLVGAQPGRRRKARPGTTSAHPPTSQAGVEFKGMNLPVYEFLGRLRPDGATDLPVPERVRCSRFEISS